MKPEAARTVAPLVVLVMAAACRLASYPDGEITCKPGGRACPDGYGCLDPDRDDVFHCTRVGCGDGIIDPRRESCDDVNDNELDLCVECRAQQYRVTPLGLGESVGLPESARLERPTKIAADRDGNLYIAALISNRIFRYDSRARRVTEFAGNGRVLGQQGRTGLLPTEVSTPLTADLRVDGAGNVYFSDIEAQVVRRIDAVTGRVDVVAGTGMPAAPGEGDPDGTGAAIGTPLRFPRGVATDGQGNLYIADSGPEEDGRVLRVDVQTGLIERLSIRVVVNGVERDASLGSQPLALDVSGDHLYVLLKASGPMEGVEFFKIFKVNLATSIGEYQELRDRSCEPSNIAFSGRIRVVDGEQYLLGADGVVRVHEETCEPVTYGSIELPDPPGEVEDGFRVEDIDIQDFDVGRDSQGILKFALVDLAHGVIWELAQRPVANDPRRGGTLPWVMRPLVGKPLKARDLLTDSQTIEAIALAVDGRLSVAVADRQQCASNNQSAIGLGGALPFELFVASPEFHRVVQRDCDDYVRILAGDGEPGSQGDGGPASRARLNAPAAATSALDCNVYIADSGNGRVRRILGDPANDESTVMETVLGDPMDMRLGGVSRPFGLAPFGLAPDLKGGLLIADRDNNRILRLQLTTPCSADDPCAGGEACDPAGWCVVPGTGCAVPRTLDELKEESELTVFMGEPMEGQAEPTFPVALSEPTSLIYVALGAFVEGAQGWMLIINERGAHRLRWVFDFSGDTDPKSLPVRVLAGSESGEPGDIDDPQDALAARLRSPRSAMLGLPDLTNGLPLLKVFVLDAVERLREVWFDPLSLVEPKSGVTTVAGQGQRARSDGPVTSARLTSPTAIAFLDLEQALIVEQVTGRLRLATLEDAIALATSTFETVSGLPDGLDPPLEGTDHPLPASVVRPMRRPTAVLVDDAVEPPVAYVAVTGEGELWRFHLVDPLDPDTWTVDRLRIDFGDLPTLESMGGQDVAPAGLALDAARNLYVSDQRQHVIWSVPLDENVLSADARAARVLAGVAGERGFAGDAASSRAVGDELNDGRALFDTPTGLVLRTSPPEAVAEGAPAAALYVADTGNNRVRRVALDGSQVITVLGNGAATSAGDGPNPSSLSVHAPLGLDVDGAGNLFVSSVNSIRLVQADDNGLVDGDDRREAVASIYGVRADKDRKGAEPFLEGVTRCIADVKLAPGQGAARPLYAVDACLGVLLRLDREPRVR